MTVTVSYYCPHCEVMVELERDEYLADKSVTPYPFEGWEYAAPDENFEPADGIRFVCGESEAPPLAWRANSWTATEDDGDAGGDAATVGCGQPFYLNFVKFAHGEELDPQRPSEYVQLRRGASIKTPDGPRFDG